MTFSCMPPTGHIHTTHLPPSLSSFLRQNDPALWTSHPRPSSSPARPRRSGRGRGSALASSLSASLGPSAGARGDTPTSSLSSTASAASLFPLLPLTPRPRHSVRRGDALVAHAVNSETYWVTVTTAVSVVLGLASSGVIVGLLLSYRCWRKAELEVEALLAEGKTSAEIMGMAEEELRAQGVVLDEAFRAGPGGQGGLEAEAAAAAAAAAGSVALSPKSPSDKAWPLSKEAQVLPSVSAPLASAGAGRRPRPQRADEE